MSRIRGTPGSIPSRSQSRTCWSSPKARRGTRQTGKFGRQLISRTDIASISGRDADRPFRERAREPHDPGFLRSEVLGEGRGGAALSRDDDLVADQPAHSWRAHQPQGQRRQCDAAHPARDVEHLHVPHPQEHAARRVLVSQSSAWADDAACLLRPGGSARDRPDRRQHSARYKAPHPDPKHGAAIQRCLRSGGGLAQINNVNWPQWVSTIKPPEGDELAKGTYRPLLAPVNFLESKKGTQYLTVWYSGPLSIHNQRGRFEFIPSNLQRFTADPGGPSGTSRPIRRSPTISATCSSR